MRKNILMIVVLMLFLAASSPFLYAGADLKQYRAFCRTEQRWLGSWSTHRTKAEAQRAKHKSRHPRHSVSVRYRTRWTQYRARCATEGKFIGGWTGVRATANRRRSDHKRRYPRHNVRVTIRVQR